jgi:hypothetical protein
MCVMLYIQHMKVWKLQSHTLLKFGGTLLRMYVVANWSPVEAVLYVIH